MIEADERSGLGESVALHDGISEAMPEFFRARIERGSPADDGEEFPAELAANAAEGPPAAEEVLRGGAGIIGGERLARPLASRSRSIFCLSESMRRGTATSTDTRSR